MPRFHNDSRKTLVRTRLNPGDTILEQLCLLAFGDEAEIGDRVAAIHFDRAVPGESQPQVGVWTNPSETLEGSYKQRDVLAGIFAAEIKHEPAIRLQSARRTVRLRSQLAVDLHA